MKRNFRWIVLCAVVLLSACSVPKFDPFSSDMKPLQEVTLSGTGKDKILLISVSGMISTAPKKGLLSTSPSLVEQLVVELEKAKTDKNIKAVLLKINSSGGTITASDILYKEIAGYKEKSGGKVGVIMMDVAASGAYYLSMPADMIMAHPTTVTGSIGVIFIRPKVNALLDKVGIGVEISKFGSLKDMGSPYRPTTDEEKAL
ncbi:MAG TPA: S49 family peptidase, partial [Smithellaceae bacterium]|nr:S49 family peptidase [Smithellaceae bacterium]